MTRKELLEKRKSRYEEKKKNLAARAAASNDAEEVRGLNSQISDINEELTYINEELALLDQEAAARSAALATAEPVNGSIVASYRTAKVETKSAVGKDKYASMEYRLAFKAYVQRGEQIPAEYRQDATADTTSIGAIIPTPIVNELIKLSQKKYGTLYAKCRKFNIPSGMKIPVSDLQATFHWVTEANAKSDTQDGGEIKTYVEFGANMGEARIAQTLLSKIVSLDLFEKEITNLLLDAYLQAMDTGIVKGTGSGQMEGITVASGVTNIVNVSAADLSDWAAFRKKVIAKIPKAFRNGEWIFAQVTKDSYLDTMCDSNGRPVWKDSLDLNTDPIFFGRPADLVEADIMADFDTASAGDAIGIYWVPEQYGINNNMQYTVRRYFDEKENKYVTKMLVICDGKVLNPNAFLVLKKAA